jgi:hypothetical protein
MPTALIRSRQLRSPADKSGFANHNHRIAKKTCETSAAPRQRQRHHSHKQQSDKPDHEGAHPARRTPQRNRIGIVRPNAFHEEFSPGEICRPRDDACSWSRPGPGKFKSIPAKHHRHSGARQRVRAKRGPMTGSARTSDVQLHIGEYRDSGSGPSDHPGMTRAIN